MDQKFCFSKFNGSNKIGTAVSEIHCAYSLVMDAGAFCLNQALIKASSKDCADKVTPIREAEEHLISKIREFFDGVEEAVKEN